MTGKFQEAISGLKTLAITKRREAESARGQAERCEGDARDFRTIEASHEAAALELDEAAALLAGPRKLTPEEQAQLAEFVREFAESTARAAGRIFPPGFDFRLGAGGRVRR